MKATAKFIGDKYWNHGQVYEIEAELISCQGRGNEEIGGIILSEGSFAIVYHSLERFLNDWFVLEYKQ